MGREMEDRVEGRTMRVRSLQEEETLLHMYLQYVQIGGRPTAKVLPACVLQEPHPLVQSSHM